HFFGMGPVAEHSDDCEEDGSHRHRDANLFLLGSSSLLCGLGKFLFFHTCSFMYLACQVRRNSFTWLLARPTSRLPPADGAVAQGPDSSERALQISPPPA